MPVIIWNNQFSSRLIFKCSHQRKGSKVSSKKCRDSGDLSSSDCWGWKQIQLSLFDEMRTKFQQKWIKFFWVWHIWDVSRTSRKRKLTVLMGMTGPASWVAILSSSSWKEGYRQLILLGKAYYKDEKKPDITNIRLVIIFPTCGIYSQARR